jgi:hypothetical protein
MEEKSNAYSISVMKDSGKLEDGKRAEIEK